MSTQFPVRQFEAASLGFFVGVVSLIYALMVNREKEKLEQMMKSGLQGSAGNICKIIQSANWSYQHYVGIQKHALHLSDSEEKRKLLEEVQLGHGDAAATERMLINLLNETLCTQDGLFDSREIVHPEKDKGHLTRWCDEGAPSTDKLKT